MKAGKRLLAGFLGAAMVLILLGGAALAGTETATRTRSALEQADPYHWVKCERERFGLCVFAGTDAEAGFRIQIAQERLGEAARLMEQGGFTESNTALEQYRLQIQAANRVMVSIRERAAAEVAVGSGGDDLSSGNKAAARSGWLSPGEIVARVDRQMRSQLQTLDRLCAQARDQVLEQTRLALEECARACARDQSCQAVGQAGQAVPLAQTNQPEGTSANSGQQAQPQEMTKTREQSQTQVQTREQNQQQNEEQEQTQEQTQEQQRQNEPQSPRDRQPSPGPADQPNHGK